MPPPKGARRKPKSAAPKKEGPNHQLNTLHDQLHAQMAAETTVSTTDDSVIEERTEQEIQTRSKKIAETLDEYLHDPFADKPVLDLNDEERWALRRLRTALMSESQEPSQTNKAELEAANVSLVVLMRPEAKTTMLGTVEWVPAKYTPSNVKGEETSSEDEDEETISEDEGEVRWVPEHMRKDNSQALYKVDDPYTTTGDPIDPASWATIREKQPPPWLVDSTDGEKKNKKKKKKKNKKSKKRKKEEKKAQTSRKRTKQETQAVERGDEGGSPRSEVEHEKRVMDLDEEYDAGTSSVEMEGVVLSEKDEEESLRYHGGIEKDGSGSTPSEEEAAAKVLLSFGCNEEALAGEGGDEGGVVKTEEVEAEGVQQLMAEETSDDDMQLEMQPENESLFIPEDNGGDED